MELLLMVGIFATSAKSSFGGSLKVRSLVEAMDGVAKVLAGEEKKTIISIMLGRGN
jgi:hypothetical protein